jgi:hypothetical protein
MCGMQKHWLEVSRLISRRSEDGKKVEPPDNVHYDQDEPVCHPRLVTR